MKDKYSFGRAMYIVEAAIEYLISILTATTFLATVTTELGMSDSMTGVVSSIISLGCVFQLFSIFFRGKRQKPFVITLSVINQLLFMLIYLIPLLPAAKGKKIGLFVVTILLAYLFYNIAHPKKINWLVSLVDDSSRGRFTANKEIVSLAVGMIFNFVMGATVDRYKDAGDIRGAFIICALTIFVLMTAHTIVMVLTPEKILPRELHKSIGSIFSTDKNIVRVAVLFVLWNMAQYISTPFYGTYQIKELGFSLKFVSIITIIYSIVRILFSRVMGIYADKTSFRSMIRVCFALAALGFFINIFTVPENGKVFYTLYYICYAIAMAGINSSLINLVFDYATVENRSDSLALCLSCGGIAGFLTTLCASCLVEHIQKSGNRFLGISGIYAQQVVSAIAFTLAVLCILYVSLAMKQDRKNNNK